MKQLLAHKDNQTGREQTLKAHLTQVSAQMCQNLGMHSFPIANQPEDLLYRVGRGHDIGKATEWFQRHLNDPEYRNPLSRHAMISAAIYAQKYWDNRDIVEFLGFLAIRCHHGNLDASYPSLEIPDAEINGMYWGLTTQLESCKKQCQGMDEADWIPDDLDLEQIHKNWRKTMKRIRLLQSPEPFFLLQYVFSKLISADKLDSASLLEQTGKLMQGDVEAVLEEKRKTAVVHLNSSRDKIRNTVLHQISTLSEEQLRKQRIFTITAPTGTGKTLTGLSAALALADRLEQAEKQRPHLISAVPFINILEQAIADYQSVFGDVLVHFGASDPAEFDSRMQEMPLQDQMLLTASWEAPVVLTTFVQLFESILTGKNKRLLKLNRLAGAIVLLDEVQAIKAEYYPLFAAVMDCMATYYGTRFILMTATQPKLFDCAQYTTRIQYKPQKPLELLPDYPIYFRQLHRTKLVPRWDELQSLETVCDAILEQSEKYNSILCVVNRVQDSIDLYHMLEECDKEILYLSTNIVSVDRKAVIQRAKEYLNPENPVPFIMVSTQTIEAGVDLDFDMAFRDLAPMESIIQSAGRVNRSGSKGIDSPIILFNTGHYNKVYSDIACKLVRNTIQNEVKEADYQQMLTQYFDSVVSSDTTFDTEIYCKGILELDYEKLDEFHMIEQQDRATVLVMKDDIIEAMVQELCNLMREPEHSFEKNAEIQKKLSQIGAYTVEVYPNKILKNLPPKFKDCFDIDLNYYVADRMDWQRYYSGKTGFIAESGIMLF